MNKRSNSFLLVYGIFLLISSIFSDYEILYKISLAATISSLCFTLSDFCLNNGYKLKNEIDLSKETSDKNDSLKKIQKYNHKMIIFIILTGKIAFILGDFLFLIITIYYDEKYFIFKIFKDSGNRLTIIAFAIVMLNYWLQDRYQEETCNINKK